MLQEGSNPTELPTTPDRILNNTMDRKTLDRRAYIAILVLCAMGAAAILRRAFALAYPSPPSPGNPGAGLDAHFNSNPFFTLLHIAPSLIFLAILPFQFSTQLRVRRPALHRWLGRTSMILGLVIGASALKLSLTPFGGLLEQSATVLFAVLFLVSLGMAWWHVRNRRIQAHREWIIRMTSVALGVVTVRPIVGFFFATRALTGLAPEQFFGVAMWMGFLITCAGGEIWIRRSRPTAQQNEKRLTAHYSKSG